VADPFGGSWYVEALTDRLEQAAAALIDEIEAAGGAARAIERGVFQRAIAESAYDQVRRVEGSRQVVVGVNRYQTAEPQPDLHQPDFTALSAAQRARLDESRARRRGAAVAAALAEVSAAARGTAPLMEPIMAAVRARASVGEISDALRTVWGVYRPA
jgi:methylmalonyl-CoA mutase N-terminal domain/subunit